MKCLCNPHAEHGAERAPNCPVHSNTQQVPRKYLERAFEVAMKTSRFPTLIEAIDQESGYSELYEALADEMSELEQPVPDWICQKGLIPKCRCENCRHERCRTALAHARGEK